MTTHSWLQDRWVVASIAITAAFGVAAALLGFIILPLLYGNQLYANLWDAICSAAGVLTRAGEAPIASITAAAAPAPIPRKTIKPPPVLGRCFRVQNTR